MSHKTLTRSGYILQKKYLTSIESNKVRKELTVTPVVLPAFKDFCKPKPYKIYLESPERIFLPRHYGIEKFGEPVNSNIADGIEIDVKVHMVLRPHQLAAARNIMKQFGLKEPPEIADPSITPVTTDNKKDESLGHVDVKVDEEVDEEVKADVDEDVKVDAEVDAEVDAAVEDVSIVCRDLSDTSTSSNTNSSTSSSSRNNSSGGGGVLSLPCGYGKTVLAIWTIAQLKKKTLVVVNKEFLMDQWMDSFDKFSNARVGILQQNKIEIEGNDVVIAMLHSLCLKDYPKAIFDEFGLVIFDECHHIASEMFSKALPKVATKYMLGLSATPERKDGLSRVFYHYLGKLFHQERREGSNLVVVKQIQIMSSSPYYQDLYMAGGKVKNTGGMITQLSEFEERNRLILFILALLIRQGRTTLVLSSRREHLEAIYKALQQANLRKPDGSFVTFGLYWGKQDMNKKQYKKMLEESSKCDIVLGTCQLAQEGLDIPTLDTLLFATPMTDIVQAVGRILRKYHSINPYVIDIIDKFGNFPKHSKLRNEFYDDEGYYCEKINIVLSDGGNLSTNFANIPSTNPSTGTGTGTGTGISTAAKTSSLAGSKLISANSQEELVEIFIDSNPDLSAYIDPLTGKAKKSTKGIKAINQGIAGGPGKQLNEDDGNEDDDDDDDLPEDSFKKSMKSMPIGKGCMLEMPAGSNADDTTPSPKKEKIMVKIMPKIIPKIKVSELNQLAQQSQESKIKVSDLVPDQPKVKVSDLVPDQPKVKVSDLVPDKPIRPKLRVSELVGPAIDNKIKVSDANPSTDVPKIKVSSTPVSITPKIKISEPVKGFSGLSTVGPSANPSTSPSGSPPRSPTHIPSESSEINEAKVNNEPRLKIKVSDNLAPGPIKIKVKNTSDMLGQLEASKSIQAAIKEAKMKEEAAKKILEEAMAAARSATAAREAIEEARKSLETPKRAGSPGNKPSGLSSPNTANRKFF